MPRESPLTGLIALHFHQKSAHQGRTTTLSFIRSNGFHIVGGTSLVSSLIYKCVVCRKIRGKAAAQQMANLPHKGCEDTPTFSHSGLDCFGPFHVKVGRKECRRYGVVFSCLSSRAIHIEVVDDLSTDSFINSLRCFIAIRGPVSTLHCDRGTNFVGAMNELQKAFGEMHHESVQQFLNSHQCQFVFNTPLSSHMGGAWERMIRTIRQVLNGLASNSRGRLNTSSLRTLFYEVMAIVNSRPISYLGIFDRHPQPEPLTPNHLLTMKVHQPLPPPGKFERQDIYSRRRWRRVQALAEQFWSRWRHEYLSTLQKRQKWNQPQKNMKTGNIVLVIDDNAARGQWKLGRVTEVHPGQDGLVRKVSLEVAQSKVDSTGNPYSKPKALERPVHKCILLID